MKAISARVARAVQRAFGLSGPMLHGRYHLRVLRTPREVRTPEVARARTWLLAQGWRRHALVDPAEVAGS